MKPENEVHLITVPRPTVEVLLPDGRILCGPRNRPIAAFLKCLPEWNSHDPIMGAVIGRSFDDFIASEKERLRHERRQLEERHQRLVGVAADRRAHRRLGRLRADDVGAGRNRLRG